MFRSFRISKLLLRPLALILFSVLFLLIKCLQPLPKNPSVLIEGCIDDGCLAILSKNFHTISPCFDSLREQIPREDEEYSIKLCCNVLKYERCIFPWVISFCGMESLDKFESELRSLNSLCGITTLQWNKCEVNKTAVPDADLELRE